MIKTGRELSILAQKVAKECKTLYVLGCFGAPLNDANKSRYTQNLAYNRKDNRREKILAATSDTFGFDCVCFIKALLWGWAGDPSHQYGGAAYQSNGVPDINANTMIGYCTEVSEDFSLLEVGEVLWIPGHIGIYIGDGQAVECTHRWKDGVQITGVHNIQNEHHLTGRSWTKHGKLPWISYDHNVDKGFGITLQPMRRGDRGEHVRSLQILLTGRNCKGNMHAPDGIFGPNTEGAVKQYQNEMGLTSDGIAGEQTMTALLGV